MMQSLTGKPTRAQFSADPTHLDAIRRFVRGAAEAAGFPRDGVAAMLQAVDEAATNVMLHGYRNRAGGLEVEVQADSRALVVRLRDDAPIFDPTTVPAPKLDIPLHRRAPGGLGVHLMREFVDRMSYRRTEAGQNELTLEILASERSAGASADDVGRTT